MIALITDVNGTPVAVHRTFITRDGREAAAEPVKASLGPVWGGAIHLADIVEGKPVVIGEGIESSASAGRLMELPASAAISAGNLAKGLLLPDEARSVIIGVDADAAGETAAQAAAKRWLTEGRDRAHRVADRRQ